MSDRIQKALQKLSVKERRWVIGLIESILAQKFAGLDVKKLKGHAHIYRVRKGDLRIIFTLVPQAEPVILAIERRSESTYDGLA